jgi:hypothetical protein
MDEIIIKRAKGAKVKVFFQGLHMTHVIFLHWFIIYNLVFQISHLILIFKYK